MPSVLLSESDRNDSPERIMWWKAVGDEYAINWASHVHSPAGINDSLTTAVSEHDDHDLGPTKKRTAYVGGLGWAGLVGKRQHVGRSSLHDVAR